MVCIVLWLFLFCVIEFVCVYGGVGRFFRCLVGVMAEQCGATFWNEDNETHMVNSKF